MDPVDDLKHFSALVKRFKASTNTLISNSFLLPDQITHYTQQKTLFVTDLNDGIGFLIDTGDFYQLNFYLAGKEPIEFSRKDKPVVIHFVNRDNVRPDPWEETEARWIKSGFSQYKSNKRMSLQICSELGTINDIIRINDVDCPIAVLGSQQPAQDYQLDELIALWRSTLDIYSNAIPSLEELRVLGDAKQILCILGQKGHVIGALHFQTGKKVSTIQYVAVDQKFRRLGLARHMVQFCMTHATDIRQYVLWVDVNNIAAINLYTGLGFTFDGMYSNQLILF